MSACDILAAAGVIYWQRRMVPSGTVRPKHMGFLIGCPDRLVTDLASLCTPGGIDYIDPSDVSYRIAPKVVPSLEVRGRDDQAYRIALLVEFDRMIDLPAVDMPSALRSWRAICKEHEDYLMSREVQSKDPTDAW